MAKVGGEGLPSIEEAVHNWGRYKNDALAVDHAIIDFLGGKMTEVRDGRVGEFIPVYEVPVRRRPWNRKQPVVLTLLPKKYYTGHMDFSTAGLQHVEPEVAARVIKGDIKHSLQRNKDLASKRRRWRPRLRRG